MDPADEEELTIWQDVLDLVMAGRTKGHICPACCKGELFCEVDEFRLYVRCDSCGKFIEGDLA